MDQSKVKKEPQEWGSEVIANIKVENENSYETTFFVEIDMEMKQERVDTDCTENCDNPFDSSSDVCKEELHDKSLESVIVSEDAVDTLRPESDLFSRQQCVKSITNKGLSECVNPNSLYYNLDNSMRPIKLEPSVKYQPMSADCTRPLGEYHGSSADVLMAAINIQENISSQELESSRNQIISVQLKETECKKPFPCNHCSYKRSQKSSLGRHMSTHTGEKPSSCNFCNYKCGSKSDLVKHMRTHTGEKPFSCNLCSCKFSQNSHLLSHMRIHIGEKPFSCHLCNYKCGRKNDLARHMKTHTGEKPFSCNLCNHKFGVKSNLVNHMRTHTGEKPFSCNLCSYKCSRKNCLVSHMRIHTD